MKYCQDCKWFERNIFIYKSLRKCLNPKTNEESLVEGNIVQFAKIARLDNKSCGFDAKYFEK